MIGSDAPAAPNTPPPRPVVITGPLLVLGNVSVNGITLVLSEGGALTGQQAGLLNVSGCVSISGGRLELPYTFSNDSGGLIINSNRTLVISEAGCLTGEFGEVTVVAGNPPSNCTTVNATTIYTKKSLSVVFEVTEDACEKERNGAPSAGSVELSLNAFPTWALIVAVVGPVGLVILIVVVLLLIPTTRNKIAPGWMFQRRMQKIPRGSTL